MVNCPECACPDIAHHEATGESVCVNCGTVLEENGIVSSIEFAESGAGSASVIGQYVSATSRGAYGPVAPSGRHFSQASREATIQMGRRKISQMAGMLHLGSHYIDAAHRLYMLALARNFTTGRKSEYVIAACLYVICRREKSPHLLIDFSDRIQTNVFVLGSVFLKLCTLLNLSLPILDPSLYIHRFASQLHLGDKTHIIATTALRLVATMKRDWIQAGRRPGGICGAALLIGALRHEVVCTRESVKAVVQISDYTLCKRLHEFSLTPAAQLPLTDFGRVVFETECDPPIFTHHARKKVMTLMNDTEKHIAIEENKVLESIVCDKKDEEDFELFEKDFDQKKVATLEDVEMSSMLASKGTDGTIITVSENQVNETMEYGFHNEQDLVRARAVQAAACLVVQRVKTLSTSVMKRKSSKEDYYALIERGLLVDLEKDEEKKESRLRTTSESHVKEITSTEPEGEPLLCTDLVPHPETTPETTPEVGEVDTWSDLDDDEITGLLLSENEVEKKTTFWMKLNSEYLKEQEEKSGQENKTPRKRRRLPLPSDHPGAAQRAIQQLKETPRVSRNINYEVLEKLLAETSSH